MDIYQERLEGSRVGFVHLKEDGEAATCVLLVNAGSMYDPKGKEGLMHLLEHMLFTFGQGYYLPHMIEANNGSFNAETSKDTMRVYISMPIDFVRDCLKYMGYIASRLDFSDYAFTMQKRIVKQEIGTLWSDVEYCAFNDVEELVYSDLNSVSHSVAGTEDSVEGITLDDVLKAKQEAFCGYNMVLVMKSGQEHEEAYRMCCDAFRHVKAGQWLNCYRNGWINTPPRRKVVDRKQMSETVVLAGEAIPFCEKDFYLFDFVMFLLGGEVLCAHLPMLLRENSGRCYSVEAGLSYYLKDGGLCYFYVLATTFRGRGKDVENSIKNLFRNMTKFDDLNNLEHFKRMYIDRRIDGMSCEEMAMEQGERMLWLAEPYDCNAIRKEIEKIEPKDVQWIARKFLNKPLCTVIYK